MTKRTFTLHFGAICDELTKQLAEQDITLDAAESQKFEMFQLDGDAITRLSIHGLISDSQKHAAHKKLMRKITTFLENQKRKV